MRNLDNVMVVDLLLFYLLRVDFMVICFYPFNVTYQQVFGLM